MSMNGEDIKQLRKDLKLTQAQLAERLNITRMTVINWEHEAFSPDPRNLKALEELRGQNDGDTNGN